MLLGCYKSDPDLSLGIVMHARGRWPSKAKPFDWRDLQAEAWLESQPKFKYADFCSRNVGLARQLAVVDTMGLGGVDAEAFALVLFVLAVVAIEPEDPRFALERQDVRGYAIEEPSIV